MEIQPPKQSKVLKWSLIVGIVIVLNLFFNYTLSLVYKEPVYENFCKAEQVNKVLDTPDACVAVGGQWNPNNYYEAPAPAGKGAPVGYCDQQFSCRNDFDSAQKVYDRNVFITLVLLGAVCVAIANFVPINLLVGTALSLAGVLSFIIASVRYWSSADNLIKVIILGISLAILIWVAMKKFKDK